MRDREGDSRRSWVNCMAEQVFMKDDSSREEQKKGYRKSPAISSISKTKRNNSKSVTSST